MCLHESVPTTYTFSWAGPRGYKAPMRGARFDNKAHGLRSMPTIQGPVTIFSTACMPRSQDGIAPGELVAGKWADITVMDIDPLQVAETDPRNILDGAIIATIVAGKVVYPNWLMLLYI